MTTEPDPRRLLLSEQLGIVWGFAERFVLPRIDERRSLWEPSDNVTTVRRVDHHWRADRPHEDESPLPEATIGWLLWHIEWWWANAADAMAGRSTTDPELCVWSGSTAGVAAAKRRWDQVLSEVDLDRDVTGLMPRPRSAAFVAGWVNFELTKNIAEIHQLLVRFDNAVG